jgi:hypothetical protein
MFRLCQWSAHALLLTVLILPSLRGDEPAKEKWLLDRSVTISAAPAPVPALKYRLYPTVPERKDGNAVPMYLRFAHERNDARKKELREKPVEWNKLPLENLPLADVKSFLDGYKYNLKQLELGARRKTADWNYALDTGDWIGLLLPDAQEMRMHAPVLVLEARLEIAEKRYADAIRTLETGFSFSQQISEAPFFITDLVGIACASLIADCLLELIERADAPNLYWALAVIPRPLIDERKASEYEQRTVELQFPELADLHRPRSPEEWDAALRRLRQNMELYMFSENDPKPQHLKPGSTAADPASKSPDLPAAKKYLAESADMTAAKIEAMSPAEVLLRGIVHHHRELCDEMFKGFYLPYPQALPVFAEAYKHLKTTPETETTLLSRLLLPAVSKVYSAQMRIERKLAAMRAIEALRMHAANGGQLPDKLDQVKVVPVPNDPGTGQPFEYERDGQTATLISRVPGEPIAMTGLRYRVTLRK